MHPAVRKQSTPFECKRSLLADEAAKKYLRVPFVNHATERPVKRKPAIIAAAPIEKRILSLRGEKVILDLDLAEVYGVATKRLNEQVKRNADRFPADFAFIVTEEEKAEVVANCEHGAIMAATVLNSPRAVQMSLFVVRAFVSIRATLKASADLAQKLALLENEIKIRLNVHEAAIADVLERVMEILDPPPEPPQPPKPQIGFKEDAVPYRTKPLKRSLAQT
jgi:leucyl aminopeptidase